MEHLFHLEIDMCLEESIPVPDINPVNNKPVIDMFLKKPIGILAILDEESHFPKATDQTLAAKLHKRVGGESPGIYLAPKDAGLSFSVMHYAGKIQYRVGGLLETNRDTLPTSVLFTMKTSTSLLVKELFQSRVNRTGSLAPSQRQQCSRKPSTIASHKVVTTKVAFDFFKKSPEQKPRRSRLERPVVGTERKGVSTVAYHFKNSLAELMNKMNSTSPHFIRCMKPNLEKSSSEFNTDFVLAQLRYTGLMGTIQMRRQGYALRITFEDFLFRYGTLQFCSLPTSVGQLRFSDVDKCRQMLNFAKLKDYKVGKTRLFFRYWHLQMLEDVSNSLHSKIMLAQTAIRRWLAFRRCSRLRQLHRQQQAFISTFLQSISVQGAEVHHHLADTMKHDLERSDYEEELVQIEKEAGLCFHGNEEIRKSIDQLDDILNQYDSDSPRGSPYNTHTGNSVGHRSPRPPIHTQSQELYTRVGGGIRRAPPPPQRSPDTRLSTAEDDRPPYAQGDPPPDYDDDESGYITPDQQSSEHEYPVSQDPAGRVAKPWHAMTAGELCSQDPQLTQDVVQQIHAAHQAQYAGQHAGTQQYAQPHVEEPYQGRAAAAVDYGYGAAPDSVYGSVIPQGYENSYSDPVYQTHLPRAQDGTVYSQTQYRDQQQPQYRDQQPQYRDPQQPQYRDQQQPQYRDQQQPQYRDQQQPQYRDQQPQYRDTQPHHSNSYQSQSSQRDSYAAQSSQRDSYQSQGSQRSSAHVDQPVTYAQPYAQAAPPQGVQYRQPPSQGLVQAGGVPGYPQGPPPAGHQVPAPPPPAPAADRSTIYPPSHGAGSPRAQHNTATVPSHPSASTNAYSINAPPSELSPSRLPPPPKLPKPLKKNTAGGEVDDTPVDMRGLPFVVKLRPVKKSEEQTQSPGGSQAAGHHPMAGIPPPPAHTAPPPPPPISTIPTRAHARQMETERPMSPPLPPPPPPPLTAAEIDSIPDEPPPPPPFNPPPPPVASRPLAPQGILSPPSQFVNAPPPPPAALRPPPTGMAGMTQQMQSVQLTAQQSPDKQLNSTGSPDIHSALLTQLRDGILLRESPLGGEIRDRDQFGRLLINGSDIADSAAPPSPPSGTTGKAAPPPPPPKTKAKDPAMPSQNSNSSSSGESSAPVDVTQLQGYQTVPEGCPQWRKAMIHKKNKQLEEDARRDLADRKAEEEKWRNVPEWKRHLILEREKRKSDDEEPQDQQKRRTEEDNVKLQSMPEWKRNILMKKKEVA